MAKKELLSMFSDKAALQFEKKKLLIDANHDQVIAIKYFIPDASGCKGKVVGAVKDDVYDSIVNNMIAESNAKQRALDMICLDEEQVSEIPPIYLFGFDRNATYKKLTAKHELRSNIFHISYIFFSETQIYMYRLAMDSMTNWREEKTEEYYYKDIVNITTVNNTDEFVDSSGCFGKLKKFKSYSQELSIVVPGDSFSCGTYGDISDQILAMRNKVRERKQ